MSNLTRHLASVGPFMNSTCKLTLILANLRTLVKETGSQKISVLKWASGFGLFCVSHSVCLQKYVKFAPSVFVLIPFPSYLVLWMSVNGPQKIPRGKSEFFLKITMRPISTVSYFYNSFFVCLKQAVCTSLINITKLTFYWHILCKPRVWINILWFCTNLIQFQLSTISF